MPRFKRFSRILLSLGMLGPLVACVSEKSTRKMEGSTFLVERVKTNSFVTELDQSGLDTRRNYRFETCIKDSLQLKSIPNHPFRIEMSNGRSERVMTDSSGCLTWTESVRYALGRNPVWVTIRRTIIGEGLHKGGVFVDLAINPWLTSDSSAPVAADLRFEKSLIPADKLIGLKDSEQALSWMQQGPLPLNERPQFWINTLRANIEEGEFNSANQEEVSWIKLDIEFEPQVRVKTVFNTDQYVTLNKGRLLIKPYLIARYPENGKEIKTLLNVSDSTYSESVRQVDFQQPIVRESFKLKVPFIPNAGNIELGLRVVMLGDESEGIPVHNFEGRFSLGTVNQLLGRRVLNLDPEVIQNMQRVDELRLKYANGQLSQAMDLTQLSMNELAEVEAKQKLESKEGFGKLGYRISRPKPNFTSIGIDKCETAVQREVGFQVETCVYHPLTLKGVPFTEFKISKVGPDGKLELIEKETSLYDGCFIWEHSQVHNYYDRQHYIVSEYIVENEKLGLRETMKIALNPWDYGFTFGRDASQLNLSGGGEKGRSQLSEKNLREQRPRPELVLHNFSSNFREQTNIIDDLLNMDVMRRYTYQFTVRVQRNDSLIGGIRERTDLRDGVYMMRFVLARHRQESKQGSSGMAVHRDKFDQAQKEELETNSSVVPIRPKILPEYIMHSEKPVIVRDGRVTTDLDITLRELYLLGSRNSVIIELTPVDTEGLSFVQGSGCQIDVEKSVFKELKDTDLKLWTYEAPQILLENSASGIFSQTAYSAREIIAQKEQSKLAKGLAETSQAPVDIKKHATLNNFAFREGLRILNVGDKNVVKGLVDQFNDQIKTFESAQTSWGIGRSPKDQDQWAREDVAAIKDAKERQRAEVDYLNNIYNGANNYYSKINGFFWRPMIEEDIMNAVYVGIMPENQQHPAVWQFAHLMCGYWLDKFYDNNMSDEQIRALGKWLVNKDDVESVEDWLRVDSTHYTKALRPQFPFQDRVYPKRDGSRVKAAVEDILRMNRGGRDFYRVCMNDPFKFFAFEKKIIVEKVSSRPDAIRYLGGDAQNYNVNHSFRVDHNFGWDSSRNYNFSVGGSFSTAEAFYGLTKGLSFLSFAGVRIGGDWSTSRSIKKGRYRAQSLSFSKGPWLVVTRSNFSIELEKYRHCLAIRPKSKAFDGLDSQWIDDLKESTADQLPYRRAGIMLCTDTMEREVNGQPLSIGESYYFLLQHFAAGAYQQDSAHVLNRPFLMAMRGADEFEKFTQLTQGLVEPNYRGQDKMPAGLYDHKVDPLLGVIKAFEVTKAEDRTGFYPGIYTVTDPSLGVMSTKNEGGLWRLFESIADLHPLGFLDFSEAEH